MVISLFYISHYFDLYYNLLFRIIVRILIIFVFHSILPYWYLSSRLNLFQFMPVWVEYDFYYMVTTSDLFKKFWLVLFFYDVIAHFSKKSIFYPFYIVKMFYFLYFCYSRNGHCCCKYFVGFTHGWLPLFLKYWSVLYSPFLVCFILQNFIVSYII